MKYRTAASETTIGVASALNETYPFVCTDDPDLRVCMQMQDKEEHDWRVRDGMCLKEVDFMQVCRCNHDQVNKLTARQS
jgi:hypothetical protein